MKECRSSYSFAYGFTRTTNGTLAVMKRLDWRMPNAPPLLSFEEGPQLLRALSGALLSTAERRAVQREVKKGLQPVVCGHVLGTILGISPQLVHAMTARPRRYYREFSIPKRGGGVRPIATPRVFLKVVQWWVLDRILLPYSETVLPDSVCAFRPGRSTLDAAAPHVGARFLLRCDLADFFGSVSASSVERVFRRMGYGSLSRNLLTNLTTLRGVLPQGAPTSPTLANLAFSRCDSVLERTAAQHGLRYSRYADDLFFSGPTLIPAGFAASVSRIVGAGGFRIHQRKSRVMGPNERRVVTGLVVSERAHPPRKLRRQLRARFHQARLRPDEFVREGASLAGWASYVNMYDPHLGSEYLGISRVVLSLRGHNSRDSSHG